jgi:hypothetical protein
MKTVLVLLILVMTPSLATAQIDVVRDAPCCQITQERVVWAGSDSLMAFSTLAAHVAPVLWFSPDEPLLRGIKDRELIDIPMAFPFEDSSSTPVVYYRVRTIVTREQGSSYTTVSDDRDENILDLSKVSAVDIDFFFYYPSEEGLGGHIHDVESVEMKVAIYRQTSCDECRFGLVVGMVNAKAHGIRWYDNTLETTEDTEFPMHILVEEGKHASCTDKNGDGYFTPGYDVNKRVNDAWGVRDVMRTGALFGGGFQSWYAKVRVEEDRVFPPLPDDSWVREKFVVDGEYAAGNAIYELRAYPKLAEAEAWNDPSIIRFVDKGYDEWPEEEEDKTIDELEDWFDTETFAKSLSVSLRIDNALGVSFVFPLFIFKNFNDPVTGGWLVNRIYLKDEGLRDFGWNIMYTTSASRWIDGYFAGGVEVDVEDDPTTGEEVSNTGFMTETGVKFRFNIAHSPVSFLKKLTDFWGLRAGVRYIGYKSFSDIGYVIEIGAGTF